MMRPSPRTIFSSLAASSILPALLMAQSPNLDAIVIGADASRIAAARSVTANAKTVQVIEVADRIGGCAFTETKTFGVPYDQGCAWLQGPDDLAHLQASEELGLTLHNHNHDNARDAVARDVVEILGGAGSCGACDARHRNIQKYDR